MDFEDKKAEETVNFFRTAKQRKALLNEIAELGLNQTDFTQKYNLQRLMIANVAVLEDILEELKNQAKMQKEAVGTQKDILHEVKLIRKTKQKSLDDYIKDDEDEYAKVDNWIDGV